ncbi:AMP-binding protein [Akkermansiaceae bacterium]|nr:AMP-binding protein [Akkermansiaceae bacterium]
MEEAELNFLCSDAYWLSGKSHVYANTLSHESKSITSKTPKTPSTKSPLISESILKNLPAHLFFQTSGSSGKPKWVAISKKAMLASAEAVNTQLSIAESDRWFIALPIFHVGGHSILARSFLKNSYPTVMRGRWNTRNFSQQLHDSACAWVSLVPTQLADIVSHSLRAPNSLKGTILGGGSTNKETLQAAQELGWRVHQSYGMTEAGSQIATATIPGGTMKILPHMQCEVDQDNRLSWKSTSQFSGYIIEEEFVPLSTSENGWFKTQDRVSLQNNGGELAFLSRADRIVKILGELVDVEQLELEINQSSDQQVILILEPDIRRGYRITPCVEKAPSEALEHQFTLYKGTQSLEKVLTQPFKRSALGKIMI